MRSFGSRRELLKMSAMTGAAVMAPRMGMASPQMKKAAPEAEPGVRLGMCSYTFRNFARAQVIANMKELGLTALNLKDVKGPSAVHLA